MKEFIQIKNIGALKDTGVIDIRSLTVIIGSSASGKSTLMKLVVLMRYLYKRVNIRAYLKNSSIDNKLFVIRFKDSLRDDITNLLKDDSFILYTVEINGRSYELKYEKGKFLYNDNIANEDILFAKEVWVSEMRSAIPALASKGTFAKNTSLGFFFDETLRDFDAATDAIKNFDLDYVGLKLDVQKGGNNQKKYVLIPINGAYEPFEFRHASSGIQTTAPLIIMAKYFSTEFSFKKAQERSIIQYLFERDLTTKYRPEIEMSDMKKVVQMHIEEPELSLDPNSQRNLVNSLVKNAFHTNSNDRTVELMLATHSPYILNHLNVLLRASYTENGRNSLPYIKPENIIVYKMIEGGIINLMATDEETKEDVINTLDLSEVIENIYNDYVALGEE
ncbi:AAA family ATPase [Hoylesella loescheii]|uniref:AAA family ATPase n=1 Tax=Hoylesella loescheii TaxID=840 RepID=UPI0028ECB883|nr:AAA family ATPase [Hoylesella loescheii]